MTKLNDFIAKLPAERQQAIARRTEELVVEEMTLRDLRKARGLTQQQLAERLGIDQVAVSALERRADVLLSAMQRQVSAMGGSLRLVVEFPDRPTVVVRGFGDEEVDPADSPAPAAP